MPCRGLDVVLLSVISAEARVKTKKVASSEEARDRFMFLGKDVLSGIYACLGLSRTLWLSAFVCA
jgi:hypothetical protein